ncbi:MULTISPECIES: hypothetical protein [Bacillus cereus group]|uniref:hypothetical protein n=1 Tax=Bacillus cereus group TaxID=86661 RepID=UPI00124BF377|nr:hypothetical protein [Bacillus cereus]KAB2425285.1 hypothetical protein F8167_01340 [Bacillus cereus]
MNTVKISLSQQTIDSTVKRILKSFHQEEPMSTVLIDENGVKITGNVHIENVGLESITLKELHIIELNRVEVTFSLLNIVIEVDIKRMHDKLEIGGITLASWDFFESNPDIRLTIGLEDFVKPNFTASMKCFLNNRDVIIGLDDFKLHDLNLPSDIASRIQQNAIDEIKNIIKDKIPGNLEDKVLDIIGDLTNYLPINNLGDWILSKLLDNRKIESMIEDAVKSKISDEVVYTAPSELTLGAGDNQINLALEDVNPIIIEIKEQQLTTTINFKDL